MPCGLRQRGDLLVRLETELRCASANGLSDIRTVLSGRSVSPPCGVSAGPMLRATRTTPPVQRQPGAGPPVHARRRSPMSLAQRRTISIWRASGTEPGNSSSPHRDHGHSADTNFSERAQSEGTPTPTPVIGRSGQTRRFLLLRFFPPDFPPNSSLQGVKWRHRTVSSQSRKPYFPEQNGTARYRTRWVARV
jgi:hypothetical protein